jgi:hypothetical protein
MGCAADLGAWSAPFPAAAGSAATACAARWFRSSSLARSGARRAHAARGPGNPVMTSPALLGTAEVLLVEDDPGTCC